MSLSGPGWSMTIYGRGSYMVQNFIPAVVVLRRWWYHFTVFSLKCHYKLSTRPALNEFDRKMSILPHEAAILSAALFCMVLKNDWNWNMKTSDGRNGEFNCRLIPGPITSTGNDRMHYVRDWHIEKLSFQNYKQCGGCVCVHCVYTMQTVLSTVQEKENIGECNRRMSTYINVSFRFKFCDAVDNVIWKSVYAVCACLCFYFDTANVSWFDVRIQQQ